MKQARYLGSELSVVETLPGGFNYQRYLVSYESDGLTLEALLTIPDGTKPQGGWPAILLNHGYVPPETYVAATNYAGIVDAFAAHGYVVLMPDYRGNGMSQGFPMQPYVSPSYTRDSLNALASLKKYKDPTTPSKLLVNAVKIGVFGHSMGGNVTLHDLVLTAHTFSAAVIWAGSVGSYPNLLSWWDMRYKEDIIGGNDLDTYYQIKQMIVDNGTPQTNPVFWQAIDPTDFVANITSPVLLQVGTSDEVVPPAFTTDLYQNLQKNKKTVTLMTYPGADHNLAPDTDQALSDSVSFFDKYLK